MTYSSQFKWLLALALVGSTAGCAHQKDTTAQTPAPPAAPADPTPAVVVETPVPSVAPADASPAPVAKTNVSPLAGKWILDITKSVVSKDGLNGGAVKGGSLLVAANGQFKIVIHYPSGESSDGKGTLASNKTGFDVQYNNDDGGWLDDIAEVSKNGKVLTFVEEGNSEGWKIVFARR
jgi:hypothetical protein